MQTPCYDLDPGDRWYLARTLPRKERIAVANLERQAFRNFLPLQIVTRRHAHKISTELAPVFARYVFLILNVERQRWRSVNGTLGIAGLVTDGERPRAIAPGVVETLIQSSDRRGALVYKDNLAVGDRVRLISGPLAESLGVLQRLNSAGRVQLLLDLIGGQTKVSVPLDTVAAAH